MTASTKMFEQGYVVGEVAGTGATLKVSLGFVPRHVELWNSDELVKMSYFRTQDSTPTETEKTMYLTNSASTQIVALATASGVEQYAGDDDEAPGFVINDTSVINVSAHKIQFIAWK
jgi:hypothetical protein